MSQTAPFVFDPARLEELANRHREDYARMQPFPHIVMDNFLPVDVLKSVLEEFPHERQIDWKKFDLPTEKKLATTLETQIGVNTRFLLYQLNSSVFLSFLETLTGIKGLIPDPHFWGGGLHQIKRGGFLKVHADFNRHPHLQLDRRLNLLLYLNQNWKEEYGGNFELWNRDMTACEVKMLPIFNRCVVFSTTDFSFHGHPEPLACPEGVTRKSIALYYYSNGRPDEELSGDHSTLFKARPGEIIVPVKVTPPRTKLAKRIVKKLVPPIFIDAYQYLKRLLPK